MALGDGPKKEYGSAVFRVSGFLMTRTGHVRAMSKGEP